MKKCIVVIPVYDSAPPMVEMQSFERTLTVLSHHDIALITHADCDISVYRNISERVGKHFSVELFDVTFFKSVEGYNTLCFTPDFYERFFDYEFMLICQLDVWLFSDQLDYWCSKGYDYIGAPIFHAYNKQHFTTHFLGIGNGGFSLRRISHCLHICKANKHIPFVKPMEIIRFYYNLGRYTEDFTQSVIRRILILPTIIAKIFGIANNLNFYISKHVNEDLIFGTWADKSWIGPVNIPDYHTASEFSFEVNPSMLYEQVGHLPFGCHAFLKWEYDSFWKKIIENETKDIH